MFIARDPDIRKAVARRARLAGLAQKLARHVESIRYCKELGVNSLVNAPFQKFNRFRYPLPFL